MGDTNGRIQAAKRTIERQGCELSVHPDWFWSMSGGIDSTAAFILTRQALETSYAGGNYSKKPLAIYLDTRVGVPLNRIYTEQLMDYYGVQLWTLRTDESFREWLDRDGAPGPGAHGPVRNELKGRQSSKLSTLADFPVFILGLAADESPNRASLPKVVEKPNHVEVYPVHRLTRKERAEIILRAECPINPLWTYPEVIKDCGCLANGDPSELDATEEHFPEFVQRLREWEESIDHDGVEKAFLGWGGLSGDEKSMERDGMDQETLSTCTDGCQRERDPAVVRAFRERVGGATVEEAVETLYDDRTQFDAEQYVSWS